MDTVKASTNLQKKVIAGLLKHRKRAISAKTISVRVGINENHDSCPKTRGLIKGLIAEGHLIGSTKDGYKLMRDAKEVQVCLNSLLKRQLGISNRIQAIYDAAVGNGIL